MISIANARRFRRDQTEEEKELWRALRAGRFAGFKFRRQHPAGRYYLDFYCPTAKLSVELDGFQHGLPEQRQRDEERETFSSRKASKNSDSGIISGGKTVTASCWKSGTRCTVERVA